MCIRDRYGIGGVEAVFDGSSAVIRHAGSLEFGHYAPRAGGQSRSHNNQTITLIKKDSLHHHKQRYTGTRAYEYLVENYPDFKYAKTSTISVQKLKVNWTLFLRKVDTCESKIGHLSIICPKSV